MDNVDILIKSEIERLAKKKKRPNDKEIKERIKWTCIVALNC